MNIEHYTDIAIIGAGPCGLFTVFEAGLLKLRCHLIDSLPEVGGQLSEIYPKKPIYDIPGFPDVLAGDLVKNLEKQIEPFKPNYTLGERIDTIEQIDTLNFRLTTNRGTVIVAPNIAIAGGLGCFEPRKPVLEKIDFYERKGVEYFIKDPEVYRGKKILISGGGDSALDWAIYLAEIAKKVTLIHRSEKFRGALDSVEKVFELAEKGVIDLHTSTKSIELIGEQKLEKVIVEHKDKTTESIEVDNFIPLFGLSPSLGPIANWGLNISKSAIEVNTYDYSTNIPGVFAVGDINTYPGKLKLILCGFHEATLMVQSAFKRINPDKKLNLKYTTVSGVSGF